MTCLPFASIWLYSEDFEDYKTRLRKAAEYGLLHHFVIERKDWRELPDLVEMDEYDRDHGLGNWAIGYGCADDFKMQMAHLFFEREEDAMLMKLLLN